MKDCAQIEADILNDGNSFISFTKNLILELLNQEVDILTFLGYSQEGFKEFAKGTKTYVDDSDEDFND